MLRDKEYIQIHLVENVEEKGAAFLAVEGVRCLDDLIRGISSFLPGPCHLFRLDGRLLSNSDERLLRQVFEREETIILGCTGAFTIPEALFVSFVREERADFDFTLDFSKYARGKLVIAHARTDETRKDQFENVRRESGYAYFPPGPAALEIEERGRSISLPVQSLGITISMRDLVLLHERDPEPDGISSLPLRTDPFEILRDLEHQISWAELQILLQNPVNPSVFVELYNRGSISEEQFQFYLNAKRILDEMRMLPAPTGEKIYASVYDVVWSLESSFFPGVLYRGHYNSQWTLDSTLYRPAATGAILDNQTLIRRIEQTSDFLEKLRENQERFLGSKVDDDSLLAIAQHFGMPTHLLDFTRSARVAAFFATERNACLSEDKNRYEIGAIFALGGRGSPFFNPPEGNNVRIPLANLGSELDVPIANLAGINFGDFRQITPDLSDEDNRIKRQQAVFIEGFDPGHLLHADRMDVYYFKQQIGVVFEDPRAGIDRKTLLPDHSGLARLSRQIRDRFEGSDAKTGGLQIKIDPTLGRFPIFRSNIFGSMGSLLSNQIVRGNKFFSRLREVVEELNEKDALSTISEIFRYYFEDCCSHVMLSQYTPEGEVKKYIGGGYLSTAMGRAAIRLANWASLNETLLVETLIVKLKGAPSVFSEDYRPRSVFLPGSLRERIALACGYYLVSWEHLRFINGRQASDLTRDAERLISES